MTVRKSPLNSSIVCIYFWADFETVIDCSDAADASFFDGEKKDITGDSLSYEVAVFLDVMSQCLRSLFRIAVYVRKATATDRFDRALKQYDEHFPASYDIDFVEHKFPKLRAPNSRWLATRMGSGIAKRRKVLSYFRNYKRQLEADQEDGVASTKATTLKLPTAFEPELVELSFDLDDAVSLDTASTAIDTENVLKLPIAMCGSKVDMF
jgi:hypothetical protein